MLKLLKRKKGKIECLIDTKLEEFALEMKTPEELEMVIKLAKARNDMDEKIHRVKPDTWVFAGTNLFGLALVLNYEKLSVISGKAIGLVMRGGRA